MGRPINNRAVYTSPPKFLDLEEIESPARELTRKRRRDNNAQQIPTVKRSRLDNFRPTALISSFVSTVRNAVNYFMPADRPVTTDNERASTSVSLNRREIYLDNSEEENEVQIIGSIKRGHLRQETAENRYPDADHKVVFVRSQNRRQQDVVIIDNSSSSRNRQKPFAQEPSTSTSSHHTLENMAGLEPANQSTRPDSPDIIPLPNPSEPEVITINDEKLDRAPQKNRLIESPKRQIAHEANSFDAYKRLLMNKLKPGSEVRMVPYRAAPFSSPTRNNLFKKKYESKKNTHLQRVHQAFKDDEGEEADEFSTACTRDSIFSTPSSFVQRAATRSRSNSTSSSVIATSQYFDDVENKFTSLNLNSSTIAARFERSWQHRKSRDASLIIELDEVKSARRDQKRDQNVADELRTKLKISGIKISTVKPEKKRLIDLPPAAEDLLNLAWNTSLNPTEVMAKCAGAEIMRKDLLTLKPTKWLNDEVINAFLGLIVERSEKSSKYPKAYTFNTFFYKNIRDPVKGYKSVARWTRKVDIFSKDVIFVPIHLEAHWCMAMVDMVEQKIEYYDSMTGYSDSNQCLTLLLDYLVKEAENKKKPFNAREWKTIAREDCPQQNNGFDCGVFSCLCAEYGSRRADLTFTQADINYFRKRMVWEICNASLLDS